MKEYIYINIQVCTEQMWNAMKMLNSWAASIYRNEMFMMLIPTWFGHGIMSIILKTDYTFI